MKKTIFYLSLATVIFGLAVFCCGGDGDYLGTGWGGGYSTSSTGGGGGGDCDDVCTKLNDCCDWESDDMEECAEECLEMQQESSAEEFSQAVSSILDASCSDIEEDYCYGYYYYYY